VQGVIGAKEGYGWRNADKGLTPEGEDCQDGDAIGMKVEHQDLIVLHGSFEES
jgi:hypothetical protein